MAGQTKNIIVGAANFFVSKKNSNTSGVADTDFTLPAALTAASATAVDAPALLAAGNFNDIGYTQEGVEVSYEPDFGDVEVDQLLDSARIFKQSMRVTVNTTLAEATLENLLVVWGQKDTSLDTTTADASILTMEAGTLGEAPTERALAFVGPAPRSTVEKQRIYHVTRAIQTESSSHALRRSEATALPVSFRVLPFQPSSGKAAYGTVRDRAKA